MADEQAPKLESFEDLRTALRMPAPISEIAAPVTPPVEPPVVPPVTPPVEKPADTPVVPPVEPVVDKKPKRFSELTRELEASRQREADLLARLATPQPAAPVVPAPPAPLPEAPGKPVAPDSNTWTGTWPELEAARAKHVVDLVKWSVDNDRLQRTVESAREVEQATARTVQEKWDAAFDAAVAIDDNVADAVKHVGAELLAGNKRGIVDVIKESEVGVEIAKELHADAEKLKKVVGMTLASAAREIGKIEAAILGKRPVTPAVPVEPLPPPPQNIGGGASGHSAGPDLTKLGDMPMAAFKETVGKLLSPGRKVSLGADRRSL